MAGYWLSSLVLMDLDFVSVQKRKKRERGQYPAILTDQAWSIKGLLSHGKRLNQDCGNKAVNSERA